MDNHARVSNHNSWFCSLKQTCVSRPKTIAMLTQRAGMSFSLQSRDVIADSIETVMGGQWYDANISIPGCDKNMPGCLIAMGRVNRPSIMVSGRRYHRDIATGLEKGAVMYLPWFDLGL